PFHYAINGGATVTTSNNPETVSVSPSSTTTYTVTSLSDANCTAQAGDMTGSATVTVNTAPTLTCPDPITQNVDPGTCSAAVTFAAQVTGTPTPVTTYSLDQTF